MIDINLKPKGEPVSSQGLSIYTIKNFCQGPSSLAPGHILKTIADINVKPSALSSQSPKNPSPDGKFLHDM